VRRFEPSIEMEYSEERFIRRELESALSAGGLDVHYQPVVAAAGGAMIGVEALLRWTHPTRGAIAPARVIFEVTEGVLIDDPQKTLQRLEALRALGVSIALDDFGTGYSSLSYLQKFPFSQIKIDRAFVGSLGTTGHAGAIIQSIVALGHALGMKVLAEGVETDEQRVLLRLAGCDEMQGFLFAKPRPAEAIDKVAVRPANGRTASKLAAGSAR